jgi:hypothetical protein
MVKLTVGQPQHSRHAESRKMIKLTLHDRAGMRDGEIHIALDSVVSVMAANPSGCVVTLTRGTIHVAQSMQQLLNLLKEAK